jgi:2,4-dienoyl-CoA reductase-like NADH-dependent reductase (Old Yellow Enzyme family)
MTTSRLFAPLSLGPLTVPNRIMVSPMCQYSSIEGDANNWHMVHLGSLAISGAGLLFVEATAVNAEGRITHGCLGLYNDANETALAHVVNGLRQVSHMPLGIQLSHAGRKASSHKPWDGGKQVSLADGGWLGMAPSAVAHSEHEEAPQEMSASDIERVVGDFARAAKRARALGFDAIELHMAT